MRPTVKEIRRDCRYLSSVEVEGSLNSFEMWTTLMTTAASPGHLIRRLAA